jgi:hypothetical protein
MKILHFISQLTITIHFQITSPESGTKSAYRTKKKKRQAEEDVEDEALEVGDHFGYQGRDSPIVKHYS